MADHLLVPKTKKQPLRIEPSIFRGCFDDTGFVRRIQTNSVKTVGNQTAAKR